MFDFLTVIEDINKAIFKYDNVESGNQNPRDPLSPPLKDSPKINPENDVFDFFSTIFNICSAGERRDCVRKKTLNPTPTPTPNPTFTDSTHIEKKYYNICKNGKIMAILKLNNSDFEVVDDPTNVVSDLYQIKPIDEDWRINQKNVIIKNKDIIKTISEKISTYGASSIVYI